MQRLAQGSRERPRLGFRRELLAGTGVALLLGAAAPAWAVEPASSVAQAAPAAQPSTDPLPKWGPFIDLDGKAGTQRNIGEGDLFVPLLQNGSSMLFTDFRGRFDDRDSREGNFGIGVRHMLASGWNLGLYGYYDRRHTALGDDFGQATFGAEALSLDWDARANLYRTVGPRIANLGDTSATSAAIVGTSVQVTTTGTHSQEVALHGFDGEIGWRVPVFDAADTKQLRVYAGGYDFEGSGVRSVAGPRGRIDLTIHEVPHLWSGSRLEVETEVQHDGPRGTQAFALLSLRIPLQIFASAAPSSLTPMERRMEDPIVRDVDVVSESRTQATPTITETATQTAGGGAFTVINSASTTGAALPGAVAAAGNNSTVLLSGRFNTGAADTVTVQTGQTLTGTLSVKTPSGRTATVSTGATISGTNVNLATVVLGSGATLSGLKVSNAFSGGAGGIAVDVANTAGNVTVENNTISVTQSGNNGAVALAAGFNNANLVARGNTITAVGSGAATTMTAASIQSNGTTATVSGNTLSASGGTTNIIANLTNAVINSGSTGNVRGGGACSGATFDGSKISFTNGTTCP